MLLKNATLVELYPPRVEGNSDVRISGTRIGEVGAGLQPLPGEETNDMGGMVVMPGLVCGHNHFYSGLARGITASIPESTDFVSNLTNLWWRLDRALDEESLRFSGLVCCVEAIKSGCTTVVDHHASPSFISGSLSVLKACFEEVGLRGVECYETTDRNGEEGIEEGIEENRRFANLVSDEAKEGGETRLVEAMIGGHAPFTLNDRCLKGLGNLVEGSAKGFHVHISEDRFDPGYSHRYHKIEPLRRLADFGLVTERSLFAHGIFLNESDRVLLNESGSMLAHNCRSNMNNGVGYNAFLDEIDTVCVGTDGIGSDTLEEVKFAYFKHRDAGGKLGPGDFIRFLQNGNILVSRCFDDLFGRLAEGYKADLTILRYVPPTPFHADNLAGHVIFGMRSMDVHSAMVNGAFVLEDGMLRKPVVDLYEEATASAAELWRRMDGQ